MVLEQIDFSDSSGGETRILLRRNTADWMWELGIGTGGGGGGGLTVTPIAFFERGERDRFKSALSDDYDLTPIFDEPLYSEGPTYGSIPIFQPGPPMEEEEK